MNISASISGKLVQELMFSRKVFVLAAFLILFSGLPKYALAKEIPLQSKQYPVRATKVDTVNPTKPAPVSKLGQPPAKKLPKQPDHSIRIVVSNTAGKTSSPWYKDILPVITLVLGLLLKELIDGLGNIKRTKKIGKRWKTELEILSKPLARQTEEIKKSIEHHQLSHNESPKMVSIASLDCENFESLDKSELLNYINRYYLEDYKEAVALAGQINLQISIIKSNSSTLEDTFKKGLEEIGKRHDKLNANFQELIQSFHIYKNALYHSGGEQALNGDRFKVIGELFLQQVFHHMEDGKFDYQVLASEYFTPMIKELDRLSANSDMHLMASFTRKCLDNVAGIKMESRYHITNLTNLMGYFQQAKSDLENLLKAFEPKKKRFRIW